MTAEEADELLYTWPIWARPEQLPPEGDWSVWLILSGRGWGKSRTGAEYIRSRVEEGVHRVALIAETAADARDVMVEGPSGILAVSPPWNRPIYEPSKRRLTWANGSIATTYSGDSPDQLRGPEHSVAWCLAGDTKVLMGDGSEKLLARIKVGDYVQTRSGPHRVTWQGVTKRKAQVYLLRAMDGRVILGTGDHPVWVEGRGFTPLSTITQGESICVTNTLSGGGGNGTRSQGPTTIRLSYISTVPFGRVLMASYRRGIMSTTRTEIRRTIASGTWSYLPMESIAQVITWRDWLHARQKPCGWLWRHRSETVRSDLKGRCTVLYVEPNIIVHRPTPVATARLSVSRRQEQVLLAAKSDNVNIVGLRILLRRGSSDIALDCAVIDPMRQRRGSSKYGTSHVETVGLCFDPTDPMRDSVVGRVPSISTMAIDTVRKLATCKDVYNITVDSVGEFFANGILVHNCDEPAKWSYPDDAWSNMEMGLRRGVQPRVIATTTPRPIPLIRALVADPGCHVTRGNTYDNLVNLPLPFIKRILKKYEGTRLGRQELYAEILDDVLGALWNRELLEKTRVKQAPGLQKIAVGVDPMGKDPDEDDDTGLSEVGIVVAGLGHNGEGYVLEDLSGPYSPNAWATVCVEAYKRWGANWIVAEKNFGGAMVASTIRTVNSKVNVQMVWASQGKAIRAEPIVSLYEQGRCHHVGMFPVLEDEQCTWTDDSKQPSPNRMDAEVWTLTKLMLDDDDEPHFDRQRHTYTPAATATKAYIIDPKRVYAWKQAIERGRRVPAYGPEDYEPLRRVFVAYLEEYQRTKDYRGALVVEQYEALREKMGDIKV